MSGWEVYYGAVCWKCISLWISCFEQVRRWIEASRYWFRMNDPSESSALLLFWKLKASAIVWHQQETIIIWSVTPRQVRISFLWSKNLEMPKNLPLLILPQARKSYRNKEASLNGREWLLVTLTTHHNYQHQMNSIFMKMFLRLYQDSYVYIC